MKTTYGPRGRIFILVKPRKADMNEQEVHVFFDTVEDFTELDKMLDTFRLKDIEELGVGELLNECGGETEVYFVIRIK
jgi:hypothetical protein